MQRDSQNIPDPSSIPLVALESMNQTHREEVEMVRQLADLLVQAVDGNLDEEAVSHQTSAWIEHTREHFARENNLMQTYGFPAYPVHSGEHSRVLQLLESLQRHWLQQKSIQPLADFLFNQWPLWFDEHVRSMDKVTAEFIQRAAGEASVP